MSFQVLIFDYHRFHDDHCRCSCRNLLGSSAERVNLHLGCRKCRAQVCEILWLHRRLVVLHGLDDIRSWELSGMLAHLSFLPSVLTHPFIDNCELPCIAARCVGNRLPRRHW
jgi:hypothetical protein